MACVFSTKIRSKKLGPEYKLGKTKQTTNHHQYQYQQQEQLARMTGPTINS